MAQTPNAAQTRQQALSELLDALGFARMSREVLEETDEERLRLYARIIVKNTKDPATKRRIVDGFVHLGLA